MPSEAFGGNANFLSQAELSAQAGYTREFMSMFDNMEEEASLCVALSWPCLRPLLELQLNEAVDAAGGLVLQALGYARTDVIYGKFKSKKTRKFKAISITEQGDAWLDFLFRDHQNEQWFVALVAAISSYGCRDLGAGIALSKDFLRSAIKRKDLEVLSRVVAPDDLLPQFGFLDMESRLTGVDRLRLEEGGYMRSTDRTSPKVFVADFGLMGPRWTETARNTAVDLIANFHSFDLEVRGRFHWDFLMAENRVPDRHPQFIEGGQPGRPSA